MHATTIIRTSGRKFGMGKTLYGSNTANPTPSISAVAKVGRLLELLIKSAARDGPY